MKNLGIYYRVSTDRQDLASQETAIENWLKQRPDYREFVIKDFKDEGFSGKTDQRPGFQKLLQEAYSGNIDTIIVYRLDRFSRHATTAIKLLLQLDEVGVGFISVTQPVLSLGKENPFRRTMMAAFAEIAELERETIVARVYAGLEAAKKRGVQLGRPKKIDPSLQAEAKKLRNEGHNLRQIAAALNISLGSVSNVLKNCF